MSRQPASRGVVAAYFDVDETLVATKTMFSFLRFYLRERGDPESAYRTLRASLISLAATGASRAEVNREYYRLYRGERVQHLSSLGQQWAKTHLDSPEMWLPAVEDLVSYRQAGARTVLISGSFFACLDPIAELLGVDQVYGTVPAVTDGVLTGQVNAPMIGAAKALSLTLDRQRMGIPRAATVAYGDHSSDLPMLRAAGHGVITSEDPVLRDAAREQGWPLLAQPAAA